MKDIIYLIGSSDEEKYKIGITTEKNLLKRLKTLQTGNSSELSYVYFFKSKYASKMERTIHRRFYDKRLVGEWFLLTKKEIDEFINICETLDTNFRVLDESQNYHFLK